MNKYILRKIYLCDSFGFNFFRFSALEVSVFTGIKNIQVFCFLMIYTIVELSSEIKRETVFLDLSRQADPGNFSSETFSETYNPSKTMFGSSGLLTIPQVVRTSPVVIFVRQVTPSAAITGSLCTCMFSALAMPGPVQKSSASSSSFSLQVTEEFVNCRVTFLSQSCRLRTRQKLGAVSPRDSAGWFLARRDIYSFRDKSHLGQIQIICHLVTFSQGCNCTSPNSCNSS